MKIGITGGTGNISRAVAQACVAAGHEVVTFNRSGNTVDGARAVQVDRDDPDAYVATIQGERLDIGIDMICFNAEQAQVSLRAFAGVCHLIHTSSGATYGFPLERLPITEETPCRAQDGYGGGKNAADRVFLQAFLRDGVPVTIFKPNVVLGSGCTHNVPGQLPGNWLRRIVDGKPLVVVGDGDAIHHFLHADDAARAYLGCLQRSECFGQIFNLCGIQPATWRQLYEAGMQVLGREVPIVGVPRADLLALHGEHPQLWERNNWRHMLSSTAKLQRCVPTFHQRRDVVQALAAVLANTDPETIPAQDPAVDALLDELVERQNRVRAASSPR